MAASPSTLPSPLPTATAVTAAIAAALVVSFSTAFAQTDPDDDISFHLVGQVVDNATGAPVPGARVSVAASEWMSVTNSEGRFILHGLRPGPHRLSVEQLGYHTLVAQVHAGTETAPLRLGIEPDPIVLEGLEVVGRRFERRRRATGLRVSEFGQHDLAASSSRSAAEMLEERIPVQRTRCDDGAFECVFSRGGRMRPTVCIDETPTIDGWNALAAYRPQDFHMIEVYGRASLVRAYTHHFMERAARIRFLPTAVGSC